MAIRLHHRVRTALRSFVRRRTVERELDEELAFHYQQMAAHEAARDVSRGAAWPARRRTFGLTQVKEACRDMRPLRPIEHFLQDLRFGARLLARGPVFTLVAVLSLALGIGANSAIFSLINAIVLRTLPVERADQLYFVSGGDRRNGAVRWSYPLYQSARELLAGRAEIFTMTPLRAMQVAAPDASGATPQRESTQVQLVSGEFFDVLRAQPQIGRLLHREDDRTLDQHPVAVISDGYWSRKFGRTPSVIGQALTINGAPFTIVGVAAPGFFGAQFNSRPADLWVPIMMQASVRYTGNMSSRNGNTNKPWPPQREVEWLTPFLRLPSSGDVPAIGEALNLALQRDIGQRAGFQEDEQLRREYQQLRVGLAPGSRGLSGMRDDLEAPLVALLLMVGLLLAIACANIASLLLARASNRHREMAIRLSIGAGRGRLIRQLLTESLLLALIGGALGLAFAEWGSTAFLTFGNRGTAVISIDVRPDWRVIAVTLAVSVFTGLLFGLLPALRSTRVGLAETLKSQTRSVIGGRGGRAPVGKLLIAAQMAFSLLLLIVAALFARSLQQMMHVDIGVDRDRLLVARIDPRAAAYTTAELPELYRRIVDRIAAVPGVQAASLSMNGLFANSNRVSSIVAEGYVAPAANQGPRTNEELVTPDYFRTVGMRIRYGRGFTAQDTAGARNVSVINETMARRYFGDGARALGKRWAYGGEGDGPTFGDSAFEIVGVVEDARYNDLKIGSMNMAFRPAVQEINEYLTSVEIRASGPPAALAADVRNALRQLEPRLPVTSIETLDDRVMRSMGQVRLLTWLTTAFGAVALFLACLGLYGTISYAVTRRTAELGVRMALGASRGAVQWLIMREALTLVAVGLAIGIPLALFAADAMQKLLFEVTPSDLAANAGAIAVLVLIAALAAYLPARRASRVDPMHALRAD